MTTLTKYLRWSPVVWAPLCLALSVSAQTYRAPQLRQGELGKASERLLHANVFNLGGVGIAQAITPEEKAFRTILGSADPVRIFRRLINDADAEGQLYALLGLRLRAPDVFRNEVERITRNGGPPERTEGFTVIAKGEVRVAHGCIFFNAPYRSIVDEIAKGRWDAAVRSSSGNLIF